MNEVRETPDFIAVPTAKAKRIYGIFMAVLLLLFLVVVEAVILYDYVHAVAYDWPALAILCFVYTPLLTGLALFASRQTHSVRLYVKGDDLLCTASATKHIAFKKYEVRVMRLARHDRILLVGYDSRIICVVHRKWENIDRLISHIGEHKMQKTKTKKQ